jgi:hypothetical protein
MPYIKQDARHTFESHIQNLATDAENAGDLNYIITKMLHLYLKKKGLRYANCNEVIGMLECAKLEIYRKVVSNYEDEKLKENGGVGVFEDYDNMIPKMHEIDVVKDIVKANLRKQEENSIKKY